MSKNESVDESTKVLSDDEKLEQARRKAHEGRNLAKELAANLNANLLKEERERQPASKPTE